MMEITLRKATPDDAPLIADISHRTFYESFAEYNSEEDMRKFLNEQFTKGKLMLEVGNPENVFFIASYGSEPAGYVKLKDGSKPALLSSINALEIARLYSVKEMIGRGVGKLLMETSITYAIQKSKDVVWLGVWENNIRAIEFYKKWGFEKFGETDFLLGDDLQRDWLMKKTLTKETPAKK